MTPVSFDIQYTEERNRLTSAFRLIWAFPHLVIVYVLMEVGNIVALLQWFYVLFTGKREGGLLKFNAGILNWYMRAYTYAGLMYDQYPNFAFEAKDEPVTIDIPNEEPVNRLTNALRLDFSP